MNWKNSFNRNTFVTTLGTAGLGLGLVVAAAGGAPVALAQEVSTPALAQEDGDVVIRERLRSDETREELYAEFTAALADELGIENSDEVDAAIRVAMMTVVDARVDEGLLTAGQAEALKTLIATSDVPLGPGPMFGPPPGAFMRGVHEHGHEGRFFLGRGGDQRESRGIGAGDTDDDAQSAEDEEASSS